MQLSKVIFWDTDYDKIHWDEKVRYVIAKVVMYGTLEDWEEIKKYYGLKKIKQEMLEERFLNNKALNFLSVVFDIPKEEFRSYKLSKDFPPNLKFWMG